MKRFWIPAFWLAVLINSAAGQDVSSFKGKRPFDFSGSLIVNSSLYSSSGMSGSGTKNWTIAGTPTVSIYGFSIPFTFRISQKNSELRQPFNTFGVSPQWRWLTLHAGYRSVHFSKYTLSGWQFLGYGFETSGFLRLGFVRGRFMKPVDLTGLDSIQRQRVLPSFARTGLGARIGLGTAQNHVDLVFFTANDDTLSLSEIGRKSAQAQKNLAIGTQANFLFFRNISLDFDIGASALTRNLFSDSIPSGLSYPRELTKLYRPNISTQLRYAGDAGIGFRIKTFNLRFSATYVQQDYATLGAYYFNSDVKRWLIAPSISLFHGKVQMSASGGIQENNTLGNKVRINRNTSGSFQISIRPSRKFSANFGGTMFQMALQRNPSYPIDMVDSLLNFRQATKAANTSMMWRFGGKVRPQTLNFSTTANFFGEQDESIHQSNRRNFTLTPVLNWRIDHKTSGTNIGFTAFSSIIQSPSNNIFRITTTISVGKKFWKDKFNIQAGFGLNTVRYQKTAVSGTGYHIQSSATFQAGHGQNLSASFNYSQSPVYSGKTTHGLSASLTYSYYLASIYKKQPVAKAPASSMPGKGTSNQIKN